MSVKAIEWAQKQNCESTGAKCLLVILANYADLNGRCYPGQERLARETEQSVDSVQRHLRRLEALGLVSRVKRGGKGKGRATDLYQLHCNEAGSDSQQEAVEAAQCGVASEAMPQPAAPSSAQSTSAIPQPTARKAAMERFNNIEEPSEEPSDSHTPLPPRPESLQGDVSDLRSDSNAPGNRVAIGDASGPQFEELARIWPWEPGESRAQAEVAFGKLNDNDKRRAISAAGRFLDDHRRSKRPMRSHLKTYLKEGVFRDFQTTLASDCSPNKVFVRRGTPEFDAWDQDHRKQTGRPMPWSSKHTIEDGWWRASLFPPGWESSHDTAKASSDTEEEE